jgi:hypothetical protein
MRFLLAGGIARRAYQSHLRRAPEGGISHKYDESWRFVRYQGALPVCKKTNGKEGGQKKAGT